MSGGQEQQVFDAQEIDRLLTELAAAIADTFRETPDLCLIGIRRRGDVLAKRLQARLAPLLGSEPPTGTLDITLYRDDFDSLAQQPVVGETEIPFELDGRTVVLVDDVLFTGRTIRAALDEIIDLGRPRRIVLVALIDRGGRELPIAADIVGRRLETRHEDDVQVYLSEIDGRDSVTVVRRQPADD